MRWTSRGKSADVEDRRGQRSRMRGGATLGIGGVLVLLVLTLLTGQDFLSLADPGAGGGVTSTTAPDEPYAATPEEEKLVDFVSFVLDDSQDVWTQLLGPNYQRARLVLFTDAVESACGFAQSATGPFYCPPDQRVYIDLGFYRELQQQFGAPGDFAQAYVLTHEIGHHVQTLTGTEAQVRQAQRANPSMANQLSVRMELQADCYAGVWGHTTSRRGLLDADDIDEALTAAAAIGDDRIQRMGTGRVSPERFTHGTSAERAAWFRRGFESGQPADCDTFNTR